VTEYQLTSWRDLPSLVVAREGESVTKAPLGQRFQEAIDEAAMRAGAVDANAYLEGWRPGEWEPREGAAAELAPAVAAEIDRDYPPERLERLLDAPDGS
jgi:hypothetical protein